MKMEDDLKSLREALDSTDPQVLLNALMRAISLVESLIDENASVWALIEEQKASEVAAHAEALKKELDRKIAETFSLINSKVVLA